MDTTTVVYAVNQILAGAGVGVWRPEGPAYSAWDIALAYGPLPEDPDQAIAVICYMQTDDVVTGRKDRYVQVRCRGNRNSLNGADVLADAVFEALHGVYHTTGFARITRTSAGISVADELARQERPDNYHIILDNPEATS